MATTLNDAQMESIVLAADPKAIVFDVETVDAEGTAVEVKVLRPEWADLRDQLLYFEVLYRDDIARRKAPAQAKGQREQIANEAKYLFMLLADLDPLFSQHYDPLNRLITDAMAPCFDNPELEARDKRSPFEVLIRVRLMPLAHEYFGPEALSYSVDPHIGAYGPFIDFAETVLKELKITQPNGRPYSRKTIATTR
jgi:hypothetical protein